MIENLIQIFREFIFVSVRVEMSSKISFPLRFWPLNDKTLKQAFPNIREFIHSLEIEVSLKDGTSYFVKFKDDWNFICKICSKESIWYFFLSSKANNASSNSGAWGRVSWSRIIPPGWSFLQIRLRVCSIELLRVSSERILQPIVVKLSCWVAWAIIGLVTPKGGRKRKISVPTSRERIRRVCSNSSLMAAADWKGKLFLW